MTGTGYPIARTDEPPVAAQHELTPEEQADVQALYDELKPMATQTARDYVLARTKAEWQEAMAALIDADWPVPPVEDPAALESRRLDGLAYTRRADPNPNLDPNLPPGQIANPAPSEARPAPAYQR